MGEESNGRAGRTLHLPGAGLKPRGEDPEHSPPPQKVALMGSSRSEGLACLDNQGRHEGPCPEGLEKDSRRGRLTERCVTLQRPLGPPHPLARGLSEFRACTSTRGCLDECLVQTDVERYKTPTPLAGRAWLHALLSDTC